MQPGVDYGKESPYPLEGAEYENQAPRPVPLLKQPGKAPKPSTTRVSRLFCASCGAAVDDVAFCENCGRVVDSDGASKCECGAVGNFTCGFYRGRIVEDTQEDTCRKKLCGEHVKLVKNRRVDRDEPLIDMCEQCKLNYEPTPLTDAERRRNNILTFLAVLLIGGFLVIMIFVPNSK